MIIKLIMLMRQASLADADLRDADLTGAVLRDVSLNRANLTRAKLIGAQFIRTKLLEADLTGADLSDSILCKVAFSRVKIDESVQSRGNLLSQRCALANENGRRNIYRRSPNRRRHEKVFSEVE